MARGYGGKYIKLRFDNVSFKLTYLQNAEDINGNLRNVNNNGRDGNENSNGFENNNGNENNNGSENHDGNEDTENHDGNEDTDNNDGNEDTQDNDDDKTDSSDFLTSKVSCIISFSFFFFSF